jgi:hypothetical protein
VSKKSPLNNIENKTNVKSNDLIKLANQLQGTNFSDEKTVRKIIEQVSKLANVPVSKQTEEQLVKTIINNKVPKDMSTIAKMAKKL